MKKWIIILCLVLLHLSCNRTPKPGRKAVSGRVTREHGISVKTADTSSINQLFRRAKVMDYSDSAKVLYLRALSESKFIDYEQGVVYAYLNLAYYNKLKGNFLKADTCYAMGIDYMKEVIPKTIHRHQPKLTRHLYTLLLRFAHDLHAYKEVIQFYRLAEAHFSETRSEE